MADEAQELPFPISGVDVSCEVDRQTPRTTARGVNVRACDPGTLRIRGGARAGLTKLVDETVSGAVGFPVQHLNVIVDPTTDALLAALDDPGWTYPDPSTNNAAGGSTDPNDPLVRNPNRTIRPGGSGVQPNRHLPTAQQSQITYIQGIDDGNAGTGGTATVVLTDPPSLGDLVVVVAQVVDQDVTTPGVTGVTNNVGDAFSNVGGGGYTADQTFTDFLGSNTLTVSLSVWFRVATGGASDQTIKVSTSGPGVAGGVVFGAFVYRGAASAGPLFDVKRVSTLGTVSAVSVGGLNLNGTTNELVVAAFVADTGVIAGPITPATNYTSRAGLGFSGATGFPGYVIDRVNASGVGPETASGTPLDGLNVPIPANGYVGIAASFHR